MATARTFTPELLPEEGLPAELAERRLYKPAGIGCNHCAFNTKKKGFSGRQALRAHSKKHRNDARAWQRPLVRQGLVVGSIVALVVLGLIGSADLKADVQAALPFGVPLVTLPELVMGWGTVAVAVALLLSSMYMLSVPGEFGAQPLVRVLSGLGVVSSLLGIWVVVADDGSGTRGGRTDPRVGHEGGCGEAPGAAPRSEVRFVLKSGEPEGCVGGCGGVAVVGGMAN